MKKNLYLIITAILISCGNSKKEMSDTASSDFSDSTVVLNNTVKTRFEVPEGYKRVETEAGSFAEYLQNLPLKPEGYVTHLYNGEEKEHKVSMAVVDMDIDPVDLQQCADAIIRLRAEYLFGKKQYDKIHFNFTNGFRCDYDKWAKGYRVRVNGSKASWYKAYDTEDYSYPTFREYLMKVFEYAGTASLASELEDVKDGDLTIGDVIVTPGHPGHAVIVVDMIEPIEGWRYDSGIMLAQSYMPAQEIEILKGVQEYIPLAGHPVWQTQNIGEKSMLCNGGRMITSEYPFANKQLKRFKD